MTARCKITVQNQVFDIDTRYTDLQLVGKGAYGAVASAYDTKFKIKVAIKKITNVFDIETNAKRILREIKLLKHLNGHENIVQLYDTMVSPTPGNQESMDVYIVTSLFQTDLDALISSQQPLSRRHVQFFLYQILRAMKYIQSAGILHRDLKPSNILVNSSCDVAICDFGLARGMFKDNKSPRSVGMELDVCMTEYVVTRYYRAPELLCEASNYDHSVDMFAIGCIFAELLCNKPFFKGRSPLQQLRMIAETLPCPPNEELDYAQHPVIKRILDEARLSENRKDLITYFPGIDKRAIDLLSKMLVMKPQDR